MTEEPIRRGTDFTGRQWRHRAGAELRVAADLTPPPPAFAPTCRNAAFCPFDVFHGRFWLFAAGLRRRFIKLYKMNQFVFVCLKLWTKKKISTSVAFTNTSLQTFLQFEEFYKRVIAFSW